MHRWRFGVVLLWLGVLAATSHARLAVWQDEGTLWADAHAKAPMKPRPLLNWARVQELRGDLDTAEGAYRRVIQLSGDRRRGDRKFSKAAAQSNIAHVYIKQGHFASAMNVIDRALFEYPDFPYAHYNKGVILWLFGRCDQAVIELTTARSVDPNLTEYPSRCGVLQ